MTSITKSNESSGVLASLQGATKSVDGFTYSLNRSLPNHSRELLSEQKSMTGNAQTVSFDVVKQGLLAKLWLKVTLLYNVGDNVATDHVLNMINRVSLNSSNNELETLFPQTIRGWINKQPHNVKANMDSLIAATGAVANGNVSYDVHIPLPFSFSMSPEKFLDTEYLQKLNVNVQFNSQTTVVDASASAFTSANCTLLAEYVNMDTASYKEYVNDQFPAGKGLEYLWENSYQEADVTSAAAATSHNLDLSCDNPIVETYFRIIDTTGGIGTAGNAAWDPFNVRAITRTNITKIQLYGNGKVLYEVNPFFYRLGMSDDSTAITASGLIAASVDGCLRIDWRLAAAHLKDAYSGGLSLKNISGPQLRVTTTALAVTYKFQVCHKYLNFVKVDSGNGRMSVSAAL